MTDVVSATIHTQLKAEVTAGSILAADKQMLSFGFPRWKPMGEGQVLTPQGYKVPTTVVPVGRRWVEGTFEGVMDFNEMEYPLNSVLDAVSPTADGTNGKKWTHSLSPAATDTHQTYSMEQGNNQHAQKAAYMFFNSLKLEMSPLMQKMSGNFMAQMFTDDITLTSSPTILAQQVVPPQAFDVRIASTYAALVGTAQVETATAAGAATSSGNITVTVTAAVAAALSGGKAIVVAITNGDTAATWAGKVRTALAADTDVNTYFNVGGSSTSIVLTARTAAANDSSLNIAIADTGSTGITPAATSANTTAGVAQATVYTRPFSVTLDIPNIQDVLFRMNSADTSYINTIEIPVAPTITVRTDADDTGMAYLTNWAAGSQVFIGVKAFGNSISGAQLSTYTFDLIVACRVAKGYNPVEDRGNAQAEWPFDLVYDSTWGKILQTANINALAAV